MMIVKPIIEEAMIVKLIIEVMITVKFITAIPIPVTVNELISEWDIVNYN